MGGQTVRARLYRLTRFTRRALIAIFILLWLPPSSLACSVYGKGWGSKWDNPVWPDSAVITWSFMAPGVALGPAAPSAWSGTNTLGTGGATDLRVKIDSVHGAGAFDAAVQRAFNTWAATANVQFVKVADQGGNFGTVTYPDIRIGAFNFGAGDFAGAAGFGPPGNDIDFPDALAGDVAFNNLNNFNIDPGSEGAPLQTGPNNLYLNDIEGLLLHELGHTLGIGHSAVATGVMCGYQSQVFDGSTCDYTHVNRVLTADDVNAVRNIYGPVPPPDGDISFDCKVDAADVLLADQIILGLLAPNAAQITRADVAPLISGNPAPNGMITMADLLLILQKSLKQINF
ncbi:MAG: matrixin family metalloprotease [Halioglobus sp.]